MNFSLPHLQYGIVNSEKAHDVPFFTVTICNSNEMDIILKLNKPGSSKSILDASILILVVSLAALKNFP